MPVIWGLDLRDIQWGKFKSSYMFGNKDYHLRRTKFVVYQIAMLFCVVSESVGTAALSGHYVHLHNQTTPLNSLSQIMSINSRKSKDSILLPESTTMISSASLHTTSLSASPSPPSSAPLSSSISSSPNAMSPETFAGPGGSVPSSSPS